jgi:hypothetical protein
MYSPEWTTENQNFMSAMMMFDLMQGHETRCLPTKDHLK